MRLAKKWGILPKQGETKVGNKINLALIINKIVNNDLKDSEKQILLKKQGFKINQSMGNI